MLKGAIDVIIESVSGAGSFARYVGLFV